MPDGSDASAWAQQALQYTNDYRATQGLPALVYSDALVQNALLHSQSMPTSGFQHQNLGSISIPGIFVTAENIAMSSDTRDPARTAVDLWINSPGHAANMRGSYTYCGVGIYVDGSGWWATQVFGNDA